ncbi:MAG: MJ0042-type zinc finger domain-containing protein [Bdellovibrionota bacterium]
MKKSNSKKRLKDLENMLIVQCPECHTKFSIDRDKLENIEGVAQFHCSKCDNLFSLSKKDLKLNEEDDNIQTEDAYYIDEDYRNNKKYQEEYVDEDVNEYDEEEYQEEYNVEEYNVEENSEEFYAETDNETDNETYEDSKSASSGYYLGDTNKKTRHTRAKNYDFIIDSKKKNNDESIDNDSSDDPFFEDVKEQDNQYKRKSAFLKSEYSQNNNFKTSRDGLKTSQYRSPSDKFSDTSGDNFDSWLSDNSNEFDKNLSSYHNNYHNNNSNNNSYDDLFGAPKKASQNHSRGLSNDFEHTSYDFKNKISNVASTKQVQKIRSWEAVFRLSMPFLFFLLILFFSGFYLQTNNKLFKKLDLSIFKTGNIAPAGLFLKNVKIIPKTLNNGENILLVTGRVLNDTTNVVDNILLESVLFDDDNNIVTNKKIKASSQLGLYKMRELLALESDLIEKIQNSNTQKKQRLAPGEQVKFTIAFTDATKIKDATKYVARIYSVD